MTLNVKIVRASVRIGGFASSQRMPSPISVRRFDDDPRLAPPARDDARHEQRTERRNTTAFVGERERHPGGEQERADRRRNQLIRQQERALHPGVGEHQVLARDRDRGSNELLAESANVSAVPRTNSVIRTTAMLTVPLTIVETRTTSANARPRSTTMTIAAPVEAVRRGAAEDAEDQGREVPAEDRHRDEERVARLGGHQQRPGRQHDAVAGVVDERCGQEPAEAPSEPALER